MDVMYCDGACRTDEMSKSLHNKSPTTGIMPESCEGLLGIGARCKSCVCSLMVTL